jgi:hypothetical protein
MPDELDSITRAITVLALALVSATEAWKAA